MCALRLSIPASCLLAVVERRKTGHRKISGPDSSALRYVNKYVTKDLYIPKIEQYKCRDTYVYNTYQERSTTISYHVAAGAEVRQ